ncbi:MAG: hypothetical protein QNJ47_17475 [Nostocaceae cyanobacterium]|nr:hypothetical protein [Nostocaceae cyanobacterium]
MLTLHRDLGTSITTIQNFQTETLTQLQQFAGDLRQTLSEFQTDTRGILEQTAVEINRAVNQSIEGMTAQRTAFQESAENAAATFSGIREDLEQALQQRAAAEQQMLQETRTGMIQILSQAQQTFQEQSNVLQTTGNEASSLMNTASDNLIETLTAQRTAFQESAENAAATFKGIREELEQALQKRAEVEQQMLQATRTGMIKILSEAHHAFKEQNSLLQTTGNEASSLMNTAKDNFLDTLGNINQTLIAYRQTVQEDLT